ncbi:MAG: CBS domain-containing protein, partial [Elusimicrobiota bacterium]
MKTAAKQASVTVFIHAKDVMSPSLLCLQSGDTMKKAAQVLLDNKISGTPVINHLGEAIGVITKTDIVRYEREHLLVKIAEIGHEAMRATGTLEFVMESKGYHQESEEDYVDRWMTPKVYAIGRYATLGDVIREMSTRKVHRLFVHNETGRRIVGV